MKKAPKAGSEIEIASRVTTWLRDEGYEVYEEVSLGYSNSVDIIAVRKPVVVAVEVKKTLSLSVLGQAKRWIQQAHLTYVAVPLHKRTSSHTGAAWVCRTLGIGLLYITSSVHEEVRPVFQRHAKTSEILSKLRPEQQDGLIPAGSPSRGRYTPWRMTVESLTSVVKDNPGITMKDALAKIKHHYANTVSARSSLSRQIRDRVIKGIRAEGRDWKLYPI